MIGGIITDGGGGITPLVAEVEEDVDARLDWAGCGGFGTEVGDGLSADGILLIVKGEDNLSGPAEMLGGNVPGEKEVPNKEHEIHEGPELDRPAVAGALCVFSGPEAEVEAKCFGGAVGSGVGGGSCLVNNGLDDSQEDCLF